MDAKPEKNQTQAYHAPSMSPDERETVNLESERFCHVAHSESDDSDEDAPSEEEILGPSSEQFPNIIRVVDDHIDTLQGYAHECVQHCEVDGLE